ncbi:lysylphosphatidylglycerol synthase transmembrane domain-containing protein [uncultured Dokdonia sp.]|uniref:lysylphosphatidylglycerol synthase transmembrane domain-containing protein n=1 Tax=uncultured Dokdonia sp. TaxID=575653 RepID=UPI00260E8BD5|nr:lysylphosphatidylglycerol synthase transmembrane domain-containing protein [uncultured Dokdonia sp.]
MAYKKVIKAFKIILPLALGVFLMWYWLGGMTSQERVNLWDTIKNANPLWIGISFIFSILSHASRAYRWNFMLEPMGYTSKFGNGLAAVMTGYFANTFVLRSGEVLRAVAIQRTDKIPFEKAFGTVVSERIADLIMLLLIMITAVILQSTALIDLFKEKANPISSIISLAILLVIGIVGLRILKKSSHPFIVKVRNFGLGILEGVKSILSMKKNAAFIFHTLFIWAMYIAMFWIVTLTVPGLQGISTGVTLAAFVIGAFAMSATNAGMGAYPIAMVTIFSFFGYDEADGNAFGSIIWGTQTIFNILIGGICALYVFVIRRR